MDTAKKPQSNLSKFKKVITDIKSKPKKPSFGSLTEERKSRLKEFLKERRNRFGEKKNIEGKKYKNLPKSTLI